MAENTPLQRLVHALTALAQAPAKGRDTVSSLLVRHGLELLAAEAAGVLLLDGSGRLSSTAASSRQAERLQREQISLAQGPSWEGCFIGVPMRDIPLDHPWGRSRWPAFTPLARSCGIASTSVMPLEHDTRVFGALTFFHRRDESFATDDWDMIRPFARGGALALRTREEHTRRATLSGAPTNRIVIEQATGILMENRGCTSQRAATLLRNHARSHHQRLGDLAVAVVAGSEDTTSEGW